MYKTFLRLNDAHTRYISSCLHSSWNFKQPFILISSLAPSGNLQIVIRGTSGVLKGDTAAYWRNSTGKDLTMFTNYIVVEIDGRPAVEAIRNFANTVVGKFRDENVRFTQALGSYTFQHGNWSINLGQFSSRAFLPQNSSVIYKLQHPTTNHIEEITIPFAALPPSFSFSNVQEYFENGCSPNSRSAPQRQNSIVESSSSSSPSHETSSSVPMSHRLIVSSAATNFKALPIPPGTTGSKTEISAFYLLPNKPDTLVFKLSSFLPAESTAEVILKSWINDLQSLPSRGVKNLILDLRSNGGGSICLGMSLLKLLFPSAKQEPSDFISSNLMRDLFEASKSSFSFKNVRSENEGSLNMESLFHQGPAMARGGSPSRYSAKCHINCDPLTKLVPARDSPLFPPERIRILSNGYCGSTCAMVSTILKENFQVKTIAIGGLPDSKMSFSSFAGLQVYNLNDLLKDIRKSGLSSKGYSPRSLPTKASLTFTIREVYSNADPSTPKEFSKANLADEHWIFDSFDPFGAWDKVATSFQ